MWVFDYVWSVEVRVYNMKIVLYRCIDNICYGFFFRIGCKKILFIGIVFELVFILVLVWLYNYLMYVILWFCIGVVCVGVFMIIYVFGIIL